MLALVGKILLIFACSGCRCRRMRRVHASVRREGARVVAVGLAHYLGVYRGVLVEIRTPICGM